MLIFKNSTDKQTLSVPIDGVQIDTLLEKEWLLTNTRGGSSSASVTGANTRRYHSLLTGSLNPPANRIVALSNVHEIIEIDGKEFELQNFEFVNQPAKVPAFLQEFHKDIGAHFEYDLGSMELSKSIYLMPDVDAVAIVYDFTDVFEKAQFTVRPFTALRDFHSLQQGNRDFDVTLEGEGISINARGEDNGSIFMSTQQMYFEESQQWWYNFLYRKEQQRQQDYTEDIFSPGVFKANIDGATRIILWASFGNGEDIDDYVDVDLDIMLDSLCLREKEAIKSVEKAKDPTLTSLCSAAAKFVVERNINDQPASTILAGYPWFLDWGRDTFISLPGLLLYTDRYDEAKSVLSTFAAAVSEGMIPNRFDDYNGPCHYNSIDASLWFIYSAFEYLRMTYDHDTFEEKLLPAIKQIIYSYQNGTRFGIHADEDGLITGGDYQTQLTWMDARCGGISFTPRYGKAIEINALWYNAISSMADYIEIYGDKQSRSWADLETYTNMIEKLDDNFLSVFFNSETGYLNDCVLPDGTIDTSLRPNQIYAASLPFSPLPDLFKESIVETVQKELLTPYGLRTLSTQDSRYRPTYSGDQMSRDSAYHQGTVWPHLIGPFIEAYLKVNNFSKKSRRQANKFLNPLLEHLNKDACIGSISEIFDGSEPHYPRGCGAQAWAVAEVLRSYKLANQTEQQ
jgi:predicted glycogen debranching enzyme